MKLIPEWKQILKKAWSVRFLALAGLLTGCELILPLYVESLPREVFIIAIIFVSIAGIISRVVSQATFHPILPEKDEHCPD